MKIEVLRALDTNYVYILHDEHTCAVIDPGDPDPVRAWLRANGRKLTHILCTHHHLDHIGGNIPLKIDFGAEVWVSKFDSTRIQRFTRAVQEGEKIDLFGQPLEILALPGHTHGQIAYYWPGEKAVFTGDTLFPCGCGRLFEGTPQEMHTSLGKLRALPSDTRIYFGHEYTLSNIAFVEAHGGGSDDLATYKQICGSQIANGIPTTPTTVAQELKTNPMFNAKSVDEFARWRELRNRW